jgi:hypothetical protein
MGVLVVAVKNYFHVGPLLVFAGFCAALLNQAAGFGFVGDVLTFKHVSDTFGYACGLLWLCAFVPVTRVDILVLCVSHFLFSKCCADSCHGCGYGSSFIDRASFVVFHKG